MEHHSIPVTVLPTNPADVGYQQCRVGPHVLQQLNHPIGSYVWLQRGIVKYVCRLWPRQDLYDGYIQYDEMVCKKKKNVIDCAKVKQSCNQQILCKADCKKSDPSLSLVRSSSPKMASDKYVEGNQDLHSFNEGAEDEDNCHMTSQEDNRSSKECLDSFMKFQVVNSINPGENILHISTIPTCDVKKLSHLSIDIIVKEVNDLKKCKLLSDEECNKQFHDFAVQTLAGVGVSKGCEINLELHAFGKQTGISYLVVRCFEPWCTVGVINTKTKLKFVGVVSRVRYLKQQQNIRVPLGGLEHSAKKLQELILYPTQYAEQYKALGSHIPKGILLRGPPGCGKTSLVRLLSAECEAHLIVVNGPELFGSLPGESEEKLRGLFNEAVAYSEECLCILFFDEVDAICPRRGKSMRGQENRLVSQLGMLMDNLQSIENLIVIGATNRPDSLDPVLRRPGRFDKEIFIGIPTLLQRVAILDVATSGLPLDKSVDLRSLSEATNGFTGADLVSLCHQASYAALLKVADSATQSRPSAKISMVDFKSALRKITPSTQRGSEGLVDCCPVHWSYIGGYEEVKIQIKQAIEWPLKHPEAFHRLGLSRPRGLLLYGPPGCSKTMLVRAAATSCHVTFLSLSGAQLFSPYVGDSEKTVSEVFQRARAGAPSIIFFDEIDSIIGKRSEGNSNRGVQERVLSTLLNEMDGIGVRLEEKRGSAGDAMLDGESSRHCAANPDVVSAPVDNNDVILVAASNRPDLLDDALIRPGRIDRLIYVPLPDLKARIEILKVHTRNMPTTAIDLEELATLTEGYTGADIENICREAALLALTEDSLNAKCVRHQHFIGAYKASFPSISKEQLQEYIAMSKK